MRFDILNSRSPFWVWWRGRIQLHHEFADPRLGARFLTFLKQEVSACSVSAECKDNEIYFHDLEIRREWWATSNATPTGTIRFECNDGVPVVSYAISVWPNVPISLVVGAGFAGYGVLLGSAKWIAVGGAVAVISTVVEFHASISIVRWFLRRTIRQTTPWTRFGVPD
jgi:hypothetical protein